MMFEKVFTWLLEGQPNLYSSLVEIIIYLIKRKTRNVACCNFNDNEHDF
jgi:hypothetical protein